MNLEALANPHSPRRGQALPLGLSGETGYRGFSEVLSYTLICVIVFCLPFLPQLVLRHDLRTAPIDILGMACYLCLFLRLGKIRLRIQEFFLLAYLLLTFTSLFYIQNRNESFQSFLRVIRMTAICGPFFLACSLRLKLTDLRLLLKLFVYGGGIGVIAGFFIWYFQIHAFFDEMQQAAYGDIILNRAGGMFGDSSAFGYLFSTWSSCCVILLFEKFQGGRHPARTILQTILFIAIFLTVFYAVLSRAATVLIIISLSAYLVLPRIDRKKKSVSLKIIIIMALIVLGQVAVIIMFRPGLWQKLQTVFYSNFIERILLVTKYADYNAALSGRISNWARYLPLFWENPFTGIGYKQLSLYYLIPPDNSYLSSLVETGIFGLLAFLGFWLTCLSSLMRGVRSLPYSFILFCLTLGTMVCAASSEVMSFWGSMPVFLALLGAVLATLRGNPARPPVDLGRHKP